MNYLIFSDAHGDRKEFDFILDKYKNDPQIKAIFYNGDSQFKSSDLAFENIFSVVGNMDLYEKFNDENVYFSNVDNLTFYQTHGHLTRADYGLDTMYEKAIENNAQVVLYGHTHVVDATEYKNIIFINPGSIAYPKGENAALGGTYAILEVTEKEYIINFYSRAGVKIDSISKIFIRK
jgi:putative phosphoesterase